MASLKILLNVKFAIQFFARSIFSHWLKMEIFALYAGQTLQKVKVLLKLLPEKE